MQIRWNPLRRSVRRRREIELARRREDPKDRPKRASDLGRLEREYVRPHWLRMSTAVLINTISAAVPFAFGFTARIIVDDILQLNRWSGGAMINMPADEMPAKVKLLIIVAAANIALHLIGIACSWIFNYSAVFVSQQIVFTLRKQLYVKLQQLQLTYFDQRITGKIMARVLDDVSVIQGNVTGTFIGIITNVMMFFIGTAILFSINTKLAIIALVVVPLWALVYKLFREKISENQRRIREKNSEIYGVVEEKVSAIRVVKAFASEGRESIRYVRLAGDFVRLAVGQVKLSTGLSFFASLINILGTGFILYIGALEVKAGIITTGDLLYFIAAVANLFSPVIQLTNLNAQFQWVLVVLHRVFEILDEEVDIADKPDAQTMQDVRGEVKLRNVSLQYPNATTNALSDISLDIPAGSNVAIMGPSGSGKTSLVNLILRFYEPTEGEVLVDGENIRDVTLESLRRHISMVPQEITIFSGNIAENVVYGRYDARPTQVIQACKEAELHDFVMSMPEKYETQVGEHGTSLSGGQRQRLAIAMSLLTDPEILILDDSTSALDAETERRIRETLETIMENRTSFVITHRIATARHADMIVVLEEGRIAEIGTHDELAQRGGAYTRIIELQRRGASLIQDAA